MMRRSNKLPERADAILTADWHLRDTVPACRTDDFWKAQWAKVDFVAELAAKYDCVVLHAGDLLDNWRASPLLLSTAIRHLSKMQFLTVYGNHDLPQHNLDLVERSGLRTLEMAKAVEVLPGAHMGQTPSDAHTFVGSFDRDVLVWHEGVWQDEPPWPGCKARRAEDVLEDSPGWDLIVTGDFHIPCIARLDGRLLVNPGSLMRQTAAQLDFRPRVYLWDAKANDVTPVYLPIDPAAVSREHLQQQQDRDKRIEAFVARLDKDWKADLSFEQNLERFLREHLDEIDESTRAIVRRAVDAEQRE